MTKDLLSSLRELATRKGIYTGVVAVEQEDLLALVECAEALQEIRGHDDWSDAIAVPALAKVEVKIK
jgi:hypothetical protein